MLFILFFFPLIFLPDLCFLLSSQVRNLISPKDWSSSVRFAWWFGGSKSQDGDDTLCLSHGVWLQKNHQVKKHFEQKKEKNICLLKSPDIKCSSSAASLDYSCFFFADLSFICFMSGIAVPLKNVRNQKNKRPLVIFPWMLGTFTLFFVSK